MAWGALPHAKLAEGCHASRANLTMRCRVSRACLSKALFTYGRMPKYPQITLSLHLVLSLVYYFPFCIVELGRDVSIFAYASLPRLKMFKMYYKGDIGVESLTKLGRTLCKVSFYFQLTVFNAFIYDIFNNFLSLSCFIKPFSQESEERLYFIPLVYLRFLDFIRLTCWQSRTSAAQSCLKG